jgi:aerobic carbon-monoxide dehydrogenase medium subunit
MLNLREIHRPKTIDEALALLARHDTVVLAGGTELVASRRRDVRAVVDLSNLGLAYIRDKSGAVAMGATTTLRDIEESPMLRAAANGVVAQAAHRSRTSLLRNQATVTGTLLADPAGILATVLAAMETTLTLLPSSPFTSFKDSRSGEEGRVSVIDFLAKRDQFLKGEVVTEALIPALALRRRAAIETVARTPRDKPIVAICAALELENGIVRAAAIALGGVGETARRAAKAEKWLSHKPLTLELIESAAREARNEINPVSDFRGSAEYRREMARVLTARALRAIG